MSGLFNLVLESLRQKILNKLRDNVRQMCREVFTKMFGKRPRKREDDMKTVLTDLPKQKIQPPAGDSKQPEWAKKMVKIRSQM